MAELPNVLFSMSDDQRHDCMACAGHPFIDTPAMDRLAQEGIRFANGFTAVPLCAPSRASCLTGVYPHIHGVAHNKRRVNAGLGTWPEMLQKAGYRTGFVGKLHYGGGSDPLPGFDRWVSFPGQGAYNDPVFNVDGERVEQSGYHTDLLAEYALDFLNQDDGRPWALCLWYKSPHSPFTPPERYADTYADAEPPRSKTLGASREGKALSVQNGTGSGCTDDWYPDGDFQAGKSWDVFMRDYARTVKGNDDALGQMLDKLDAMGQAENTLVIHTADHGFFNGEFGLGNKRWMYDPAIRIPYLIRFSNAISNPGRVEDALVLNLDLPATIVEAAGLSVPDHYQSLSLRSLFNDEREWDRDAVFIEYFYDAPFVAYPSMYCVRTAQEKLIHYLKDGDTDEFYDLIEDPDERYNKIDDADYAVRIGALRDRLENEKAKCKYEVPDLSIEYEQYQNL